MAAVDDILSVLEANQDNNPVYYLEEGDILVCNVDGKKERFLVHINQLPRQLQLSNVSLKRKPNVIWVAEKFSMATKPSQK